MQLWGIVWGAASCALLGGFAVGARVSLLWQHTRLMRNVSEDTCIRCTAGFDFVQQKIEIVSLQK